MGLVVSDDHEGIKSAVSGELPGGRWQRCVGHFERTYGCGCFWSDARPAYSTFDTAGR